MKIFVNGQKQEFNTRGGDLAKLLNRIQKKLNKGGDVIVELKLNGETIEGDIVPVSTRGIKVIEITTRTHRRIVIESLYFLEKYYEKFTSIYNSLDEITEISDVVEMVRFTEWLLSLAISLPEVSAVEFMYEDYSEYLEEFKEGVKQFLKAFEKEDYERMFEILDDNLIYFIESFILNSNDYLNEVIKEEQGTQLYS